MLIFILVLSCMIVIHEFGHFLFARLNGVKVEQFSLGFGPELLKFQGKETKYTLCLIPLGGFVKMAGENPDEEHTGASWEFSAKSPLQRFSIIFAGPLFNYVLGFCLFASIFLLGSPVNTAMIGEVLKDSPAEHAGILKDDKILSINSVSVTTWEELVKQIQESAGDELELVIQRNEENLTLNVEKEYRVTKNLFGQEVKNKLIGILPSSEGIMFVKYNLLESLKRAGQKIYFITVYTYVALFKVITGAIPVKQAFTGPVGIYMITKEASRIGLVYLLHIIALLSTSLAIFNLMPIPVLDGGHILFILIEKLRGKPISMKVQEKIHQVSFIILMALVVLIFYNDFARLGWIDKAITFVKQLVHL